MDQDGLKSCPFCSERIQAAAIKCRYCGEWLEFKPESVAAQNVKKAELPSEETHVVLAAESSLEESGRTVKPPVPTQNKEIIAESPKIVKSPILTPKRLQLVGFGLLALSVSVMGFTLRGVDLANNQGVEKLTEAICRMLVCAAFIGWGVRSGSGKRKGYGLASFAATLAILSVVFAYNFRVGWAIGRQQRQESNRQEAASFHDLAQQMTNEGPVRLRSSTGDANTDVAMGPLVDFLNDYKRALDAMNVELADQLDVFSVSVVTNKSAIESEIRKRTKNQATIQKYQQGLPLMIDSARKKFALLNLSEAVKNGVLIGFENIVKAQVPVLNEMFGLRLQRQKAESDLLHFLLTEFDRYHVAETSIVFDLPSKQTEYNRLSAEIGTVTKDSEAFQNRENDAVKAARGGIAKLTND